MVFFLIFSILFILGEIVHWWYFFYMLKLKTKMITTLWLLPSTDEYYKNNYKYRQWYEKKNENTYRMHQNFILLKSASNFSSEFMGLEVFAKLEDWALS